MYGSFLVLYALIVTGYVIAKKNLFDTHVTTALNRFIVYFAFPCLIVHKLATSEIKPETMSNFIAALCLGFFLLCFMQGIAYVYAKLLGFDRSNANVAECSMASTNNGFMGFPISIMFAGDIGLFYMLAFNSALNLYFFSLCIITLRRNKREQKGFDFKNAVISMIKMLGNPNILALIVGLILCGTGIKLPAPAEEYMRYIGGIATPMAMIYIGTSLAKSNLIAILKNKFIVESCVYKLAWMPLMTAGIVTLLPLPAIVKQIAILNCSFPTAATVPMLAEQEEQDSAFAGEIVFLSTLFSAVTLPIAIALIQRFIV